MVVPGVTDKVGSRPFGASSYAFRIFEDLDCIAIKWFGPYNKDACLAYLEEMNALPLYVTRPSIFHDVRSWDLDIESREMERLAWLPRARTDGRGELRVAMLVENDLAFGMLRIMASLRSRENQLVLEIFRTYQDAVEWLELPQHQGEIFDTIEPPDEG